MGTRAQFSSLGQDGPHASVVGLGTVTLGLEYGLKPRGQANRPAWAEAAKIVEDALSLGITFFDTAHDYGSSELVLGEVLSAKTETVIIATKCRVVNQTDNSYGDAIRKSLERSLKRLRRDYIDIFQLHNPRPGLVRHQDVRETLLSLKHEGLIRLIGVSGYGEDVAFAAIHSGYMDALQVSLNLLDQRLRRRVIPLATSSGLKVVARSVLLKGVLSPRRAWLPAELDELQRAATRCEVWARANGMTLVEAALRFALSTPGVASVLVGTTRADHLADAIAWAEKPALHQDILKDAAHLAVEDASLIDPRKWPLDEQRLSQNG